MQTQINSSAKLILVQFLQDFGLQFAVNQETPDPTKIILLLPKKKYIFPIKKC